LQKRFFDYYLMGKANGWSKEPRVWLNLRRPFTEEVELRKENEWPLKGTKWTKLYLDAADTGKLTWTAPEKASSTQFQALSQGVTWYSPPLEEETEITGPMALKLFISSSTPDADFFVTFQAFSPEGVEVEFQGTVDPHTPLGQGWLRASHRKLDPKKSAPWRPYHTHDDKQLLTPGEIYELDIEVWPLCIILPKGFKLALNIAGKDFERPGGTMMGHFPASGSGPWLHNDPKDRPSEVFGGTTALYTGAKTNSYLLLPIIPKNRRSAIVKQ
jgi:predicted acyl esterase